MGKLLGYLRLMRPVNSAIMGFAVIVGAALATQNFSSIIWPRLLYMFITSFTLTGASMVINDYFDREIDAINEPNRPLPSGLLSVTEALTLAFILTALGFLTAYVTNIFCFITALIGWIITVTYTTVGKRSGLPGNFLVSACVIIPFIYGSLATINAIQPVVFVFISMVFLANTGREITKGIVDYPGDKKQNVKTLAVRYGEKSAAITAAFFYISAVILSPIPWFLNLVSFWFIPLVAITDFGLVFSSFLLVKDFSRKNAKKNKNLALLFFLLGLLAFIIGVLMVN